MPKELKIENQQVITHNIISNSKKSSQRNQIYHVCRFCICGTWVKLTKNIIFSTKKISLTSFTKILNISVVITFDHYFLTKYICFIYLDKTFSACGEDSTKSSFFPKFCPNQSNSKLLLHSFISFTNAVSAQPNLFINLRQSFMKSYKYFNLIILLLCCNVSVVL